MIINEKVRKSLEATFRFDEWREVKQLDTDLFIWQFFFLGEEFMGWQPHQVRNIEPDQETQQPPLSMATLISVEGETPMSIRLDAHELASRAAALDFLLGSLAQFQLPYIERLVQAEEQGLGEVVFGTPERTCLLFVRANLVGMVRNIAREPINVEPFARNFDHYLASQPDQSEPTLTPEIELVEESLPPLEPGAIIPFRVSEKIRGERRVWYKFFSNSGKVRQKDGQLFYHAAEAEVHEVKAYAIIPGEGVGESRFLITET